MRDFFTGLDLGKINDYSALVVVERVHAERLEIPHVRRWPLGTPYPVVVADVKATFERPLLRDTTLVVDGTGVGVAVVDLFAAAGIAAAVEAYSITCGLRPGDGTVPKKDLVGAVQVALGCRRLKMSPHEPLGPLLMKELENFRMKVSEETRNESYGAFRDGDNDDLVLAAALAIWYASEHGAAAGCYSRGPAPGTRYLDGFGPGTWRT